MKMLTIICRDKFESAVVQMLNDVGVKGYTVMSGLGGKGQTGTVSKYSWTETNVSFMVALEDQQVGAAVKGMKQLYMNLLDANQGEDVALKVFLQPCEVIL